MGRTAAGVKGIWIDEKIPTEKVIGMVCVSDPAVQQLLVVSQKGFGKRSEVDAYRLTNRGGKGVKALNITEKTGALVAIKEVDDNDDLMIITKAGILIRSSVAELRVMGRNTQGVKLIRLKNESDEISSVTKIEKEPEPEEVEILDGAEATEGVEVISEGDASKEGKADVSTEDSERESTEGDIVDDLTEE
jgi:DNA gyrase subunit A